MFIGVSQMESTVYSKLQEAKSQVSVSRWVINLLWLGGVIVPPVLLGLLSMWLTQGNCNYAQSLGKIPAGYVGNGGIVTMIDATPAQMSVYCTEVRNTGFLVFAIPSGFFFFFASSALRLLMFGKVIDDAIVRVSIAEKAVQDFEDELSKSSFV